MQFVMVVTAGPDGGDNGGDGESEGKLMDIVMALTAMMMLLYFLYGILTMRVTMLTLIFASCLSSHPLSRLIQHSHLLYLSTTPPGPPPFPLLCVTLVFPSASFTFLLHLPSFKISLPLPYLSALPSLFSLLHVPLSSPLFPCFPSCFTYP